jgi:hypothetical protein
VGGDPLRYTGPSGLWLSPALPQGFVDGIAGFGGGVDFGLTAYTRQKTTSDRLNSLAEGAAPANFACMA